jgi:hypothetical protein
MTPSAPVGPLHLDAAERLIVEEATRLRARDRAVWRVVRRLLKVLLSMAGFAACSTLVLNPPPLGMRCRAKQSEAKGNLKALYVTMESDRAESSADVYSVPVEWLPRASKQRYRYFVSLGAEGRSFVAIAIGAHDDVRGDLWFIDDEGTLTNTQNACR